MADLRARAVYKKKDGIIAISDDQTTVTWTPLSTTGAQTVSLAIPNITSQPHKAIVCSYIGA